MKLCAVIEVRKAGRVKGVEPPTWTIREAHLVSALLHQPHTEKAAHHSLPAGQIRVCVPLDLVQETLPLSDDQLQTAAAMLSRTHSPVAGQG
jgi:hypothetical protein